MKGFESLPDLLENMQPELADANYLFVTLADSASSRQLEPLAFASVRESEGMTLVLDENAAGSVGVSGAGPFRRITLNVHSSLEAVGLTSAVSGALAGEGISANMIAGFYHDHLFVPAAQAGEALRILKALEHVPGG